MNRRSEIKTAPATSPLRERIRETTVQTKGYGGAECLQASRFLEQALGVATADQKTAEYHQEVPTQQQVRQ